MGYFILGFSNFGVFNFFGFYNLGFFYCFPKILNNATSSKIKMRLRRSIEFLSDLDFSCSEHKSVVDVNLSLNRTLCLPSLINRAKSAEEHFKSALAEVWPKRSFNLLTPDFQGSKFSTLNKSF